MEACMALLIAAVVLTGLSVAKADGTASPPATVKPTTDPISPYTNVQQEDSFEKWCECIKKPCDWFCWGAEYQYRAVYQNT